MLSFRGRRPGVHEAYEPRTIGERGAATGVQFQAKVWSTGREGVV